MATESPRTEPSRRSVPSSLDVSVASKSSKRLRKVDTTMCLTAQPTCDCVLSTVHREVAGIGEVMAVTLISWLVPDRGPVWFVAGTVALNRTAVQLLQSRG